MFLAPPHYANALDDERAVSQMARALRPFASIDIEGFARLVLVKCGFDRADVDRLWRAAVAAERARRRAFPAPAKGRAA